MRSAPRDIQKKMKYLVEIVEASAKKNNTLTHFQKAYELLFSNTVFNTAAPKTIYPKETYTLYAVLSAACNVVVQQYHEQVINERAKKLKEKTKTVIAPVFTRHPCCSNPYIYPITGPLIEALEKKDSDTVQKQMEALQAFDFSIPTMTLKRELTLNFPLLKNFLLAVVEYEMEQGLPAGSVARPQNWGGYDGDRAPVTGEVVLATQILETQYILQLYQEQLKKILVQAGYGVEGTRPAAKTCNTNDAPFYDYVTALLDLFKSIDDAFDPAWRLVKTKAIIYADAFVAEGGKLKRDTINQFFAGDTEAISEFIEKTEDLFRSWGKGLSKDPATACHQLDQEVQTIFHQVFSRLPACRQGIQILRREANNAAVSFEARKATQALHHLFENAGFHMTEGQGRLGSEVIVPAAHALLEADGFSSDSNFLDAVQQAVETYTTQPPCSLEKLASLPSEAQNVVKYFQSIAFLNEIHPRNMPILILANFDGPNSFLCAFYLALRTGMIKIRGGKVIESKIMIVPLLESPQDHFAVADWFQCLFLQPLIHSYYTCIREFIWMSAFSDTPRERGIPEALISIEMATHQVYEVFKTFFPEVFRLMLYRHQLGRGSSGLRSGEVGIDLTTRRHPILNTVLSRTLQSGESDDAFSTPERARKWLDSELKLLEKYSPYDPKALEFLRGFAKPGADAFEKLVMDPKGRFNQLLLKLYETEYIFNHAPLGSRKNDPTDLSKLSTSIVGGQRMIGIVRLLADELLCYVHAFYPFVISMEDFLAKGGKLETLQQCYRDHIFFQRLISKLEELIYFSDETVIERDRSFDPELVDELLQKRKAAIAFILQISGQSRLLEKRPELEIVWEWRKGQQAREGILKSTLYPYAGLSIFKPASEEALAVRKEIQALATSSIICGRYA